jgi:hypothetical protein
MNIIFTSDREKIVDVSVNRNTPLKAFLEGTDFDLEVSEAALTRAPKGNSDVVRVTFFLEEPPSGHCGWGMQSLDEAYARRSLRPADPWETIEGWRALKDPNFHRITTLWQGEHKPDRDPRYERDYLKILGPRSGESRLRISVSKWHYLISPDVWFVGVPI